MARRRGNKCRFLPNTKKQHKYQLTTIITRPDFSQAPRRKPTENGRIPNYLRLSRMNILNLRHLLLFLMLAILFKNINGELIVWVFFRKKYAQKCTVDTSKRNYFRGIRWFPTEGVYLTDISLIFFVSIFKDTFAIAIIYVKWNTL